MRSFRVEHRTEYLYGTAMADGFTVARLLPRDTPLQVVRSARIDVSPIPDEWEESLDPFGNRVVHFAVHHPHYSLTVVSHVEVGLETGVLPDADEPWQRVASQAVASRGDTAADVAPSRAKRGPRAPRTATAAADATAGDAATSATARNRAAAPSPRARSRAS